MRRARRARHPSPGPDLWPLRLIAGSQALALLTIVVMVGVQGKDTPTGYLAIGTAIVANGCLRCLRADTMRTRVSDAAKAPASDGHEH